jgi:hypothetical protein
MPISFSILSYSRDGKKKGQKQIMASNNNGDAQHCKVYDRQRCEEERKNRISNSILSLTQAKRKAKQTDTEKQKRLKEEFQRQLRADKQIKINVPRTEGGKSYR